MNRAQKYIYEQLRAENRHVAAVYIHKCRDLWQHLTPVDDVLLQIAYRLIKENYGKGI